MAPPRLRWSFEMRLVVDMLFDTDDGLSSTQRSDAFNTIFEDQIRDFGFDDQGVDYRRLRAQYEEKKKLANKDWIQIHRGLSSQQELQRQSLEAQIRQVLSQESQILETTSSKGKRGVESNMKRRQPVSPETPTPLSKRSAIGFWAPESDPRKSLGLLTPPSRGSSQTTKVSRRTRKPPSPPKQPKVPYTRPDGQTIMLPANAKPPRIMVPPVSQHLAQPPEPELLFRLWQEDPTGRNSRHGFWSRRHHNKNALPSTPPKSSSIDATDIFDHMDREFTATPWVSATNRLIWILYRAISLLRENGQKATYISVIGVKVLDKRGVFWARPFHDEVRQSYGFTKGAGNYRGTYEWLIFRDIPKAAILHTFEVSDLLHLATSDPGVSRLLRFDTLRLHPLCLAKKIAMLKAQSLPLSVDVVNSIARLTEFFVLEANSASESSSGHISAIVTGLCEGWGLDIQLHSEQEWQQLANHFANRLRSFEPRERQNLKFAFLNGIAWGCGDLNAKHTVAGVEMKVRKATAVGLASPSEILAHELDAMKLDLKLQEKKEQRALLDYHNPAGATARKRKRVSDYASEDDASEVDASEVDLGKMNEDDSEGLDVLPDENEQGVVEQGVVEGEDILFDSEED